MTNNKTDIISRLISLRAESGLNSKEFATKANIDPSNYSSIETGKRTIGDRVMMDICNAFGINFIWLKTGKEPKYSYNTDNEKVAPNDLNNEESQINTEEMTMDVLRDMASVIKSQSAQIDRLISEVEKSGNRADRMLDIIERREGISNSQKKGA